MQRSTVVDRRPRILEVLFSFRIGGSELLGLELASQLANHGADVFCTALDGMEGPLLQRCEHLGVRVVDLGLPRRNVFSRNGLSLDLARRLRALNLDAIHLQHFLGLNKLGIPARLARVPRIVVTEHSVLDVSQSLAGRTRVRFASGLAHAITVIHPSIKEYLADALRVREERITVIPVGVDLSRWHASDRAERRAALGIGEEFVAVFAGRLAPVKNVPALIRAFLDAAQMTGTPSHLLIVGDGPEMPACREAARSHALGDRVKFIGETSDTRPFVAAGDVFAMSSLSEGTPRALLEAMACGVPGISTAVGGIPSLLHGRGWLAPAGDLGALTAAFAEAMRQPAKRAEYGALARTYVREHFDAAQAFDRYRTLLLPGTGNNDCKMVQN
jgi:glycosyltransferase involved in cell wall biosynthesis